METQVAVVGANGRLGSLVCDVIEQESGFAISARMGSKSSLDEMLSADIVVDVTHPGVSEDVVGFAAEHAKNVVVGTSGWSADRIAKLEGRLRPDAGVIIIPNFSLGSVLATRLATVAARFYDSIEIVEAHHAGKVDSPSGTAVRTAELMEVARGSRGPVKAPYIDQLARGQQVSSIPIHSLRLAGVVARQEVIFGGTGELLSITHDTISNSAYEAGIRLALSAARTATGVTVGLDALLGLDSAYGAL